MKKRFLGALLALCMCLTLLPGTARSAYEPPTEVLSVSVSVPTPVADGKFADAKPTAESSAPYFVGSSRWTRVTAQGGTAVLGNLPVLLGVSLLTGTLTGFVASLLFRAMKNIHFNR